MNPSKLDTILVIIPVLNEEATIVQVIQSLQSIGLYQIRVVDNGSRDRSAAVAFKAGAEVLHEPIPGYGRACWRGLQAMPDAIPWCVRLSVVHRYDKNPLLVKIWIEQLDDQVRKWLSSSNGLQIDRTQNCVAISSIFDWFGQDWQAQYAIDGQFTGSVKERSILNFISNYVNPEDKEYLEQGNYKLNYLNYDWSLNRQ
ncbi:MAG: glycosyltransferase [Leptolyngbyaceae cyanobacterium RM2_2_4]|nr:glycosyltransferase [Leptolyngbyaceae cyanobacterium SM1_4_3]NJO48708.1 glycosyltransferase [Leptolyngbyaceae cyanobacterium RM2_2_4]